jgi:hypothetical protein
MPEPIVLSAELEERALGEAKLSFSGNLQELVETAVDLYLTLQAAMRQLTPAPVVPMSQLDVVRVLKSDPMLLEAIQEYFGGKRVELADIESGAVTLPPKALEYLAAKTGYVPPVSPDAEEALARSIAASDEATLRLTEIGPEFERLSKRVSELRK